MDLDPIENLLSKSLNKFGRSGELQAAYILSQANKVANGRFEAVKFLHGILTLSCASSIVAQEIQFEQSKIIEEINQKIKPTTVKRLSYRIKS